MSELLDSLRLAGRDDVRGELGTATGGRRRRSAERLFYLGLAAAIAAAVLLGFSRTFFLRQWFPEWARAHGAPETIFYVHGVVFAAWFLLLLVQPSLVTAGRVDLHRRLGLLGAALAVAVAARAAAEEHRALRARGDPARGAAARRGAAGACRERQGRSRQIAAEARSAGHGYGAATASTPRTTSVKSGSPGPPGLSPSSKLIVQLGKVPVTCAAGAARAGSPASAVPWLNRSRT
jgi:hypothetical protein